MGNRLQGHYYGYTESRNTLPEKTPLGKKCERKSEQEPWPKLRTVGSPSYEASELNKISFQTKINLSSARGGRLVPRPRWTPCAILPLYTTASLPIILGPEAQALSYLVPTKYLFLPYSPTQSSEIPFYYALSSGSNNYILQSSITAFSGHPVTSECQREAQQLNHYSFWRKLKPA